jgi:hypothetical protein
MKGENTGVHLQPHIVKRTAQKAQGDVALSYPTRYLLTHRHVAPQPTVISGSTGQQPIDVAQAPQPSCSSVSASRKEEEGS